MIIATFSTSQRMENAVCGFCHQGDETKHCGKLHVENIDGGTRQIAAHHKCMVVLLFIFKIV